MSLNNDITNLQESIYSSNFDISNNFLSDSDVVKNMLKENNPKLDDDDINMMIDGYDGLGLDNKNFNKDFSGNNTSIDENNPVENTISDLNVKRKTAKLAQENNIYPLSENSSSYQEARALKKDIRKSTMKLVKDQKSLMQDLVKMSIQTANAISGAAVLVAPLSFNLPAAISLVLLLIDTISKVIDKIMNIIDSLEPLKKLNLVLPKKDFDIASKPIQIALKILLSIFEAVSFFKKLIDKLFGSLKDTLDGSKSQKKELEKEIEEKKKEKKDLIKDDASQKDIDNKQKEINTLLNKHNLIQKGSDGLPEINDGEFNEPSVKDLLKNIDSDLANNIKKISIANNEIENYVYDVYLPDGSIISNLSIEELDEIKEKYEIIFKNETKS